MKLLAKTFYGLEEVLAEELISLGAAGVQILNRAVSFEGDKYFLYKANYCCRTALSVLVPVESFRVRSKDELYRGGLGIKWDRYLDPDGTFSVVPVVNSKFFEHSGFAALTLKDSIADYFRNKYGRRPSVDQDDPSLLVNLHISNDRATVSLDSSVVPLYKRGYRKEQAAAPLNEVLAAGILLISGWNASGTLVDPMCGSGTIPIEAGLLACRIPPGSFRTFFGFQKWKDYDADIFEKMKSDTAKKIIPSPVHIYASDLSERAVEQSVTNVTNAGLSGSISVNVSDIRDVKKPGGGVHLFLNPPYGLRLQPEELNETYALIGSTLKHSFPGSIAWLITSNSEALKHVGLRPREKRILFNGPVECTLVKYELYEGSKKTK